MLYIYSVFRLKPITNNMQVLFSICVIRVQNSSSPKNQSKTFNFIYTSTYGYTNIIIILFKRNECI